MFSKIFPIKIYTSTLLHASSGVVKRWPLILFFTYGNKKKSFGRCFMKSMFWVLKNAVVWADVWELALSWWRVIRLRRLVFLISWKTTGKQMAVYHSELTVLRYFGGTIATCSVFPKKPAIICLEVFRAGATFETNIQSTAVYFRARKRKSTIHHLPRYHRRASKHRDCIFGAFLSTNCHEPVFKRLTNSVGSNVKNFLMNIECMLVPLMPKVDSISR